MTASDALQLQLELDSPAEPIQGRIGHRDAGERIPFTGWLELMAAIGRLTGSSTQPKSAADEVAK
jgi:hypothetical protein